MLIGPADGSDESVMRYFSVEPGGTTPYHSHGRPHLVRIGKDDGVVIEAQGNEHPLAVGQQVYLPYDEVYGLRTSAPLAPAVPVSDRGIGSNQFVSSSISAGGLRL